MAKWIGGIIGAVISGLVVVLLAQWWLPGDDSPSDGDDSSVTVATTPVEPRTVEAGGFRTVTLTDVRLPGDPDLIHIETIGVDLDTGDRHFGSDPDVNVDLNVTDRASWLRARIGAEASSSPSYEECAAAVEGLEEYVQDDWGERTICVRTNEGRISSIVVSEIEVFLQAGSTDLYTVNTTYDFTTWALNP